ncbi:hypothetical protein DKAM_1204 [Desulfurococcus amylolyticus 1221n]|uniref:Uncharacterized protein n=1 Tax=Desulfurococcus amylolyticus (strain DSM 18924 / JCM 16383 / VKM B-2413 / 1221n) TaxID=490899 RepID=B8D5Z9_DESA1|nr:hypothetical protein DKAM_1204 [Desulfurococcus amylolyticus 1221n]
MIVRKGAISVVRCPHCGFEAGRQSFKPLKGPWRFRFYSVEMLECPRCRGVFNYYSGISPTGKRSEFVIMLKPRVKTRALKGGTR